MREKERISLDFEGKICMSQNKTNDQFIHVVFEISLAHLIIYKKFYIYGVFGGRMVENFFKEMKRETIYTERC